MEEPVPPEGNANVPQEEGATPTSQTQGSSPLEKSENGSGKKGGWTKGKKRKKLKDLTAPRQPLTGYVRFLNDRREQFRAENPNMPFAEITKVLAAEWSALPLDQKQEYLTAAEQARERYLQEMAAYKQSESYRLFKEQARKKPKVEEPVPEESNQQPNENHDISGYDIPIFTEEFLDHNKSREAELRQLRKSNTDYEQQNATIQTYLAGLHTAIDKLSVETQQLRAQNITLQQHLNQLRQQFTTALAEIPLIPGVEAPTPETVDSYMNKLLKLVKDEPTNPVINNIRNAVLHLELPA